MNLFFLNSMFVGGCSVRLGKCRVYGRRAVCQSSVTLVVEADMFPHMYFSLLAFLSFKKLSHYVSSRQHCCYMSGSAETS